MIVRENTEGEYSGAGGRVHQGFPMEVATDLSVMTRAGVERIQRFAFRLAQSRPRKLLTVVTKSNAQRHAMVMWDEIAAEVAKEFPDVQVGQGDGGRGGGADGEPAGSLDTIVATNLHADILSDLAAALAGSLGIGPTANINPERVYPSMFEPIHGSAFDIMGKGLANPVGTFWTAAMMLEHLGETEAARRLMQAVEHVTANVKLHTRDLGGTAMTADVTEAVCAEICSHVRRPVGDGVSPLDRNGVRSECARDAQAALADSSVRDAALLCELSRPRECGICGLQHEQGDRAHAVGVRVWQRRVFSRLRSLPGARRT